VRRGHFLAEEPPGGGPHWCERSVLARIHRLTLAGLRREIEPATAADLLRFLARWQHVAPGAQLHGVRGLAEVVGQLQGFHAAAGAWERHLLPARVAGYQARWLDELCLGGEVVFGRLAPSGDPAAPRRRAAPTRNGPVTLALREDLPWLCAAQAGPAPALGPSARDLVAVLSARGASFVSELTRATGRLAWEIEAALWELVSAGVVTCDAFAGLRTLIDPPDRRVPRRAAFAGGRWSLLGGGPAAGPPADEALERVAWLYLRRYGVVLRDLLVREAAAPPWRELLRLYRTLEARGSVRGGRFVAGFSGEQFALPEAVEALRAVRRAPRQGEERVVVSASDPLNLIGILTPGARVAAGPAGRVRFVDGVPAAEGSTSVGAGAVTAGRSAQLS
jgi:ATP-dependent Lhr-like helicase